MDNVFWVPGMPEGGTATVSSHNVRQVEVFKNRVKGAKSEALIDNSVSGGEKVQFHTMTCHACGTVVFLNKGRTRPRAWCSKHNAYMCDRCEFLKHRLGDCVSFLEGMELAATNDSAQPFAIDLKSRTALTELSQSKKVW